MVHHYKPEFGGLRQEDCCDFEADLGYIMNLRPAGTRVRICLKQEGVKVFVVKPEDSDLIPKTHIAE